MILIFDDNKFRREALCRDFRFSGMPTMGADYADCKYYTFPLITILMYPKPSMIEEYTSVISKSSVCVLVLKKDVPEKKFCKNIIIDPNGSLKLDKIVEIIKNEYGYNLTRDFINYILVDEEYEEIYFGGKRLWLEKREYSIVRFFTYNQNKIFSLDDIFEYLHLKIKPNTFFSYISTINGKCYKKNREDIIIKNSFGFGISPVTGTTPSEIEYKKKKLAH